MENFKKFLKILLNPFIWMYLASILIIFLISTDVLTIGHNILIYIILFITGIVTIIGIFTNPTSHRHGVIKINRSDIPAENTENLDDDI